MKKVLIFTDSRGIHKLTFRTKQIFAQKVKKILETRGYKVDMMLCPFTWTSTLDFIEIIENKIIDINDYDKIILFTGIVDFSPRPLSNFDACYNPKTSETITFQRLLQTNAYIYNNKKSFFEKFIPKQLLNKHLSNTYDIFYNNEDTRSLISLEINKKVVLPYLKKLENKIIYINSNKIVPNWEGNYIEINKNGRPKNINVIEEYAAQMKRWNFSNFIDLSKWSHEDIKKYTVDNMHLSYEGSEWILKKLLTFF